MKIYLDNNLGVTNVEQEELTQDTIGYNILKVYIPNAVLTPYNVFTCYYGALLQNGRKVGWFAMEARTSSDADYEENYTLYKATLEQCVVSVEGKVYIGCQVLLGNSGNATLIKKNTAVVQFNVRKSVAINNDILVLDPDQTTTDVLESYKNLLENALTTYATKATTYTKTEVDSALALKADKTTVEGINTRVGALETDIADLESVQNVVDIVPTYSALQSYDTSKLEANDKVQVITDESHDSASTIYNWNGSAWQYVGAFGGNSYTKQESDNKFALKSTAVTHTGNQLKDKDGNNIYPNLEDGSVGNEKTIYATFKNIDNLITDGDYELNIVTPKMVLGGLNGTTGNETTVTNRYRSGFLRTNCEINPNGLKYFLRFYAEDFSFVGAPTNFITTRENIDKIAKVDFPTATFVRIVVGRTDDANMTDADLIFTFYEMAYKKQNMICVPLYRNSIDAASGKFNYDLTNQPKTLLSEYIETYRNTYISYTNPVTVIEFDKDFNWIKYTHNVSGNFTLNYNTKYIRIRYRGNNNLTDEYILKNKLYVNAKRIVKQPYKSDKDFLKFSFATAKSLTTGHLILPTNYSNEGKGVPLIIFVHSSNQNYTIAALDWSETYDVYMQYLADNGYAVCDFYGWDLTFRNGSSTWGNPKSMDAFISGTKYVLEAFNIDKENVFVSCKSLGGIVASALCYQNIIKINACGMLAPALDPIEHGCGYNQETRQQFASDMNFTEDTNGVFTSDTFTVNQNYYNYMTENYDNLLKYNPSWMQKTLSKNDKLSQSFNSFNDFSTDGVYKFNTVPTKIWCAQDDVSVSPKTCYRYIKSLQNAGCEADIRYMPNGTGRHSSVDISEDALQTENVTTKLGVSYATIPTGFYELVEFFNNHLR